MATQTTQQPPPSGDFNFDSASTSPYVSCPSSPQRFGNYYFSAPTSPTRAAAFYRDHFHDDYSSAATAPPSPTVPFSWEEKPGKPLFKSSRKIKTRNDVVDNNDFEFKLSVQLDQEPSLSPADELFDGGKIRLLLQPPPEKHESAPMSLPPRQKITDTNYSTVENKKPDDNINYRGQNFSSSRSDTQSTKHGSNSVLSWYNKLKIKDLLLFRSISEGHKEKYGMIRKRCESEDGKNLSFRSSESGSSRRRVSAHEWHYTANRAAAEEMRKKTFLPYKRGLLGCLGFHAPVVHELSRGFGSYVMRET